VVDDNRQGANEGDASAVDGSDASAQAVIVAANADRAREMYRRFLESDYPDALAMAEEVLRERPDDVMALAIQTECQAAICKPETVPVPRSTDAARALMRADRVDSEMPTGIEVVVPEHDPVPNDDVTPVYVTVTRGEPSREMCRRFLESDHPAALLIAESLLQANPDDRMARAIAEQCRAALEQKASPPSPESQPEDDTQVSMSPPSSPSST
jgi:hypothetical protein